MLENSREVFCLQLDFYGNLMHKLPVNGKMIMKTMKTLAVLSLVGETFRCFSWRNSDGTAFSFTSPMSEEALDTFLEYNPNFSYDGILEEILPTDIV